MHLLIKRKQYLNLLLKNVYVRKVCQSVSSNTRDQFDAVTVLMNLKHVSLFFQ